MNALLEKNVIESCLSWKTKEEGLGDIKF